VFAASLFTSAGLLFWVQPLIAKMLLPLLGGSPSVWNTCMVFFQALLLAGYAYALVVSRRLSFRNQAVLHISLLLAAGVFLPLTVSERMLNSLPTQANPTAWLLGILLFTVGPPFFVLSATAPLLQKWFSHSDHKSARDPYFLYAVSNAGSMLALLAFPFLLEPSLELRKQTRIWSVGYIVLIALITCCAVVLRARNANRPDTLPREECAERVPPRQRFQWVMLAFIPSSLMLGVTTYISTDVASVPLIWIIPLALYLLTFVLAFANTQVMRLRLASLLLPVAILPLALIIIFNPPISVWMVIALHLAVFFLAAFTCHRRLALARPHVKRLPEYYLWVAVGGVLGGIFNALLAPLLFSTPLEYPLIIIIALMARTEIKPERSAIWLRVAFPTFMFLLTIGLSLLVPRFNFPQVLQNALVLFPPLALCYPLAFRHRVVFALALLAIMLGARPYLSVDGHTLITERNFFGVWRVTSDKEEFRRLYHGTTIHGGQYRDPAKKCVATSYYHQAGPVGQIFEVCNAKTTSTTVAAIGLGAGTIGTYSSPRQHWDFYEIDPTIVRIASDPHYFTFLSECTAAPYRVIIGDARLRLGEAAAHQYGLIIMDAFSSDSVPTHLLTRQAVDLYLSKLAEDGLLAFHISNRYLNLEPLLSGLSRQAGLSAFIRVDDESDKPAKFRSVWVVFARTESALGLIANDSHWRRLKGDVVWSDDFSNILDVLR
jgi:hypothetical protein